MNKTILVVDDEQSNVEFFEVMFPKMGFNVLTASNGKDALETINDHDIDLVLLDNVMPIMSGKEMLTHLKQSPRYANKARIPVIMFSALQSPHDKAEGYDLGVVDYITKPFNLSEVLARIHAALRTQEMAEQLIAREHRTALFDSLNKLFVYFTKHLRESIDKLRESSSQIDITDSKAVLRLLENVKAETNSIMATLEGLEDEIANFQGDGEAIKKNALTLAGLEEKYSRHYRQHARN